MTKIDTAIALPRSSMGTLSRVSVLRGPVGRNNKQHGSRSQAKHRSQFAVEPTRNAANATGIAIADGKASSTREYAPTYRASATAVAISPPTERADQSR